MVQLTTKQEKELIALYQTGSKTKDLCLKYGWSVNNRRGPLDILKKNNILIRMDNKTHAKRYNIDDNYFKCIDSKDKAYFLGLIYADGSMHYKKAEMKLPLQESDKHILDTFSKYIKSNKPLRFKKAKQDRWANMYSFIIENRKICADLNNLNVLPKKEDFLNLPNEDIVPKKYLSHFVRGFFDGDGSVYILKKDNYPGFAFAGTKEMIYALNELLFDTLQLKKRNVYKRFKERKTNSGYQVSWTGTKSCKIFYEWLYKDCDDLFICRKKEKFEKIVNSPI